MNILVADDNRDWVDTLAFILRAEGHQVRAAYDGREALEAAAREPFDAAILDIGMPKVTGYELARRLRPDAQAARPVLIAVTAYGRESDRLRAQMTGFDHHFAKPVDPAVLLELLARL